MQFVRLLDQECREREGRTHKWKLRSKITEYPEEKWSQIESWSSVEEARGELV